MKKSILKENNPLDEMMVDDLLGEPYSHRKEWKNIAWLLAHRFTMDDSDSLSWFFNDESNYDTISFERTFTVSKNSFSLVVEVFRNSERCKIYYNDLDSPNILYSSLLCATGKKEHKEMSNFLILGSTFHYKDVEKGVRNAMKCATVTLEKFENFIRSYKGESNKKRKN